MSAPTPVYGLAARQPLALTVLLFGLVGGLTLFWWLFPVALLVYAAMVWLVARDPVLVAASRRRPQTRQVSPTFRFQIDMIERTSQEIQRSVTRGSGAAGRLLLQVGEQTRGMVAQANALCEKGQQIERYLASSKVEPARRQELQHAIEHIQAQLQHIAANLDNVLAESVRLRTSDTTLADDLVEQVAGRMSSLQADVTAFQQQLDNTLIAAAG